MHDTATKSNEGVHDEGLAGEWGDDPLKEP